MLLPIYMVAAIAAILMLNATQITEESEEGKPSTFGQCLVLLGKPFILPSFLDIICHVGINVGTSTTALKILMERLGMTLADAGLTTSLCLIFRAADCFLGVFVLQKIAAKTLFTTSVLCMLAVITGLLIFQDRTMIYVCIILIRSGNSNVFPVIFSQALLYTPGKRNEVSELMIMGLFGGITSPLAMGVASGAAGQSGAMAVTMVGVSYLMFYTLRIRK